VWAACANKNPIPISRIPCPIRLNGKSIRIPRASSTSALPHLELAARLTCFATRAPAAAATIAAADVYGLPVSTTHVLSSGVAGTMAANGSGLQMATVRNIALAWVLTLPAAMMISGFLYWSFAQLF